MSSRISASNARMLLLGVMLASALALMFAVKPGSASASVGFCENKSLAAGEACESAETEVSFLAAEVTSGSGEICVEVSQGSGSVKFGKECGDNRAEADLTEPVFGHPWVLNDSSKRLSVFGLYNT